MSANLPLPGPSGHHAVQFYSDTQKLCASVADFLAEGIPAGQPCLVIATRKHRDALLTELAARDIDVDALVNSGDIVLLDADETLARFMVDGQPDAGRFARELTAVMDTFHRGRAECTVRAYGEMVDLLWRSGNPEGAIRLEQLWDQMTRAQPISLLCGYSLGCFYNDTPALERVSGQHTHTEILRAGNV